MGVHLSPPLPSSPAVLPVPAAFAAPAAAPALALAHLHASCSRRLFTPSLHAAAGLVLERSRTSHVGGLGEGEALPY
eukprot:24369-Prymnesium_polylepis.1